MLGICVHDAASVPVFPAEVGIVDEMPNVEQPPNPGEFEGRAESVAYARAGTGSCMAGA